jgi:hypothetical protein
MAKIANDVLPDNFDYKTKPRLQDKPTSDTDFWSEVESDSENSFSDYEPTPKKPKLENSIVLDFDAAVGKLRGILSENVSDSYLVKHAQNFVKNANRISTGVQLAAFFESVQQKRFKVGAKIHVQPTSTKRRAGASRSRRAQRSGRPVNGVKKTNKRKRNLAENVQHNRANAKSHGEGH